MVERPRSDASNRWLGQCPNCAVDIPAGRLLVEYTTADGWPRMFAECPECQDVVHPA